MNKHAGMALLLCAIVVPLSFQGCKRAVRGNTSVNTTINNSSYTMSESAGVSDKNKSTNNNLRKVSSRIQYKCYVKVDRSLIPPLYGYEQSQYIFVGKVVKTEVRDYIWDAPWRATPDPYYISSIQVEKSYKGGLKPGLMVQVVQWGNGIDYVKSSVLDDGGYFKKGDRLFLGMARDQSSVNLLRKKYNVDCPYSIMPLWQYWLDEKGNITSKTDNLLAENCKTLTDLENRTAGLAKEAAQKASSLRMAAASSKK